MRMRFVFDWAVFREQVNFGGWILVNQIGAILFLYVDLLVVNRLLGPNAGGQYAAILQWSILLRMFSTAVGSIFQPQMLYLFAQHNLHELAVFSQRAVRVLGLMLGIPVIWISGLAVPLLTTWAGPSFATFGPLLLLATAHLCVNLAVTPLFFTQQVLNKVRIPAAVNLLMGVLNVGLALLLAGSYHWGMHGVAAAGMIVLTAKNTIFTTVYTATVLGRRRYWFAGQVGLTAALTVIFVLPLYVLTTWLNLAGWPRLIGAGTAASLIYLLAVWRWFLPVEDRAVVRQQVAHLWSTMPLARAKQASDT
jgi:membrane protein EpsK